MPAAATQSDPSSAARPAWTWAPAWTWTLAWFAGALVLRAWHLSSAGLDHFDEGVYALSARGVRDGTAWVPNQILFSPPAFFGLVGALARWGGLEIDMAALALNAVLGSVAVALAYRAVTRWSGPAAGSAAALLLAANPLHLSLSRSGLTDVAFALAFFASLDALVGALERPRAARAVGAGLWVGLAWNVKYHGWLAAAICGPAALAWRAFEGARAGRWRTIFAVLAGASLVAVACYLPWAWYVQSHEGGYAALARYQRGMLRPGWVANLVRQARFADLEDLALARAALPLAAWVALLATPAPADAPILARRARAQALAFLAPLALALATWLAGSLPTLAGLALVGVALALRRATSSASFGAAAWVLASGLATWTLLTPLYRPYARLVLPGVVLATAAAGLTLASVARAIAARGPDSRRTAAMVCALLAGTLLAAPRPTSRPFANPWRASDGLRQVASAMADVLPRGARVYVLGEPALAHYLLESGREAVSDVPGSEIAARLQRETQRTWVATGRYARSSGAERALEESAAARLTGTWRYPFQPKDQRVLDDDDPWQARAYRAAPDARYEIVLRAVDPPAR